MNRFEIYTSIAPQQRRPFRIIETQLTIDGPRSRICDGSYATLQEAEAAIQVYALRLKDKEASK